MPDVVVIASVEMVAGLRLAGMPVLPARNPGDVAEQLRELTDRRDVELVLVAEHLLAGLDPQAYRQALDSDQPYVVPLPLDWQATRDALADFEVRLGRILGCRINLAAALRRRRGGGPSP
jgi:vacuolar-type H+-ATPase subunit F/Vma7